MTRCETVCLDQIDRRSDRLRARDAAGLRIVPTPQPCPKLPAANGPDFAMTIDHEIGVAVPAGGAKQGGSWARDGERSGHRYGALLSTPSEVRGGSVWGACNETLGRSWPLFAHVDEATGTNVYMLDTNICIYVIKNRPVRLRTRGKKNVAITGASSACALGLLSEAD